MLDEGSALLAQMDLHNLQDSSVSSYHPISGPVEMSDKVVCYIRERWLKLQAASGTRVGRQILRVLPEPSLRFPTCRDSATKKRAISSVSD